MKLEDIYKIIPNSESVRSVEIVDRNSLFLTLKFYGAYNGVTWMWNFHETDFRDFELEGYQFLTQNGMRLEKLEKI